MGSPEMEERLRNPFRKKTMPATIAGGGQHLPGVGTRDPDDGFLRVLGDGFPSFRPICGRLRTSDTLYSAGLGALGLFGWRRKRKNAAAIAAV